MNKLLRLLFFCLLYLSGSASYAQSLFSVEGIILNENDQPVSGATIKLDPSNLATTSDTEGHFKIANVKSGNYELQIKAFGYSKYQSVLLVKNQSLDLGQIKLSSKSESIDEVSVYGRYYQQYKLDSISGSLRLKTPILELPQNIQIISADLMADQQVFDIVDGITRNISGATRQGHWDNQYANLRMRGSKIPAFRNGMNIEASWGPTAEDASMIERIEFVKGPAGFMLANGEPGGFYNVVTKNLQVTRKDLQVSIWEFQHIPRRAGF